MVDSRRDNAISEVIGFVLIIALIAIIASLYLTYVVPATGRDLEIAHMDVIQNQFLDYKSTVDSLWINGQYNTQVSSPFTLGTNPGSTQGSFINLPLFQPVTSGGTLTVNTDDTIVITADSRYNDNSIGTNDQIIKFVSVPDHLYVSFKTNDITQKGSISITPNPASKGNWEVNLSTLNQSPSFYNILTITISKNGYPTMSNVVINNSIVAEQFYQIDLADDAYGLKESFVYPFDITIVKKNGDVFCTPTGYHIITNQNIVSENMGSLEYRSNNNYWISQNYIYQYGGVFLQQDTGGVVKLLPTITIEPVNETTNLARVTIHGIKIPTTIPSKVGGSSIVEVLTALPKPATVPLASGVPNSRWVNITINAKDVITAQMWKDALTKIRQKSNANPDWIKKPEQSGNSVWMNITGSSLNDYDIVLETETNTANIDLSPTSY
jgi:hypothetical protein